jgi:hypothetical protein
VFGDAGNDEIHASAGPDILIGGFGNDSFYIDLDCKVQAGDIIDGGIGTDTIYSHRSQSELVALGLIIRDIENFETIDEHPNPGGPAGCEPFIAEPGEPTRTTIQLAWSQLPDPDSVHTTTSGILALQIANEAPVARDYEIRAELRVLGHTVAQVFEPTTLSAESNTSVNLDLADFVPDGVDTQSVPASLLELPVSSVITVVARVVVDDVVVEFAIAPVLWGHIENGDTAVLYREDALRTVYNHGDLAEAQPDAKISGRMLVVGARESDP